MSEVTSQHPGDSVIVIPQDSTDEFQTERTYIPITEIIVPPPPLKRNKFKNSKFNPFSILAKSLLHAKRKPKSKVAIKIGPPPIPILHERLPLGMAKPLKLVEGCLPGLQHLIHANQFYVQHCEEIHGIDALLPYEPRDRYQILNKYKKRIYYAVGESDFWRWTLSGARPFRVKILDHHGNIVLTLTRPWTFGLWWLGGECTGNRLQVRYSTGKLLGKIKQRFTCLSPVFDVEDPQGNCLLNAKGPPITCIPIWYIKYYTKFLLLDPNSETGKHIGKFIEFPIGIGADNDTLALSLTFPEDLEVETKALLLGLLFVVHFMYFEVSDAITGFAADEESYRDKTGQAPAWTINPRKIAFRRENGGHIPGKFYPCKMIIILVMLFLITSIILWAEGDLHYYGIL